MIDQDPELQSKIDNRFKQTVIIYFGQVSFVLLTAIAGYLFVSGRPASGPSAEITALWVLVFFLAVAAIVARRILTRWDRLRDITLLRGIDGLLATLQTNTIIVSALAEMIVIAGLISAFLQGQSGDLARSAVIALVVMIFNYPRRRVWETIVDRLKGV